MHIYIAGGAGFVGSSLALHFRRQYPHYAITCIDNLSRKGAALNVPRLREAGITFVQADTRYAAQLKTDRKIDILIDAAAEPSVLAGLKDDLDYLVHTNFNGTVNLLQLARQHGAGFVFLSTSRVYPVAQLSAIAYHEQETQFVLAPQQTLPGVSAAGISEDFPLLGSRSLYGATKLASELIVDEFHSSFGLRTVINRCGVIAGPWQMGKVDQGVVALWLAHHFAGKPLEYIGFGGKGKQVRDLLHVADLCRLIDHEVHHLEALNGGLFNVGGGPACACSLAMLTGYARQLSGHEVEITAAATDRPGDIPIYITDNSRITAATGWQPQHLVPQLLHDTYTWITENEHLLSGILF